MLLDTHFDLEPELYLHQNLAQNYLGGQRGVSAFPYDPVLEFDRLILPHLPDQIPSLDFGQLMPPLRLLIDFLSSLDQVLLDEPQLLVRVRVEVRPPFCASGIRCINLVLGDEVTPLLLPGVPLVDQVVVVLDDLDRLVPVIDDVLDVTQIGFVATIEKFFFRRRKALGLALKDLLDLIELWNP